MNGKFIILDCKYEENVRYNDCVDLCEELYKMFKDDKTLDTVEIFIIEDDYIKFLKDNTLTDNADSRLKFIELNERRDYNQVFINSPYSEMIDPAILPVALYNEKSENKNFQFLILDETRKQLSEYLEIIVNNNSAADPVFNGSNVKKVWVSNNIFSLNEKIFDNEKDFVDEVLYASNYGISDRYKRLRFEKDFVFTMGFIYVIAINKIPRVVTRDFAKNLSSNEEDIINYEINIEKIEEIIANPNNPQAFVLTNFLIYPNEINDVVDNWLNVMADGIVEQLKAVDKMNDITNTHTKRRKN